MAVYVRVATIAAGVAISAGMAIYEAVQKKKEKKKMDDLQAQLTKLQGDLDEIKRQNGRKKERSSRRRSQRRGSIEESETVSMYSAVDTLDDDEFYDISDYEEQDDQTLQINNDSFLLDIDDLFRGTLDDQIKARDMLIKKASEVKNVEYFWRLAKAYKLEADAVDSLGDKKKQWQLIQIGTVHAECAVELEPTHGLAQKWLTILLGLSNEFLGPTEKLKNASRCYKHLSLALQIHPNDVDLLFLSAHFKYEIAVLSWIERKGARLVADLPDATLEEATSDAQKAHDFSLVPSADNLVILSKCHLASANYAKGFHYLNLAKAMVPLEEKLKTQIEALVTKYGKFNPL